MASKINLTRAWKKGGIQFTSTFGVKDDFAWDLLANEEIKVPVSDCKRLNFNIKTTPKEASKYLESKGWKWVKIDPIKIDEP